MGGRFLVVGPPTTMEEGAIIAWWRYLVDGATASGWWGWLVVGGSAGCRVGDSEAGQVSGPAVLAWRLPCLCAVPSCRSALLATQRRPWELLTSQHLASALSLAGRDTSNNTMF